VAMEGILKLKNNSTFSYQHYSCIYDGSFMVKKEKILILTAMYSIIAALNSCSLGG
jgi:hypothetical protein